MVLTPQTPTCHQKYLVLSPRTRPTSWEYQAFFSGLQILSRTLVSRNAASLHILSFGIDKSIMTSRAAFCFIARSKTVRLSAEWVSWIMDKIKMNGRNQTLRANNFMVILPSECACVMSLHGNVCVCVCVCVCGASLTHLFVLRWHTHTHTQIHINWSRFLFCLLFCLISLSFLFHFPSSVSLSLTHTHTHTHRNTHTLSTVVTPSVLSPTVCFWSCERLVN